MINRQRYARRFIPFVWMVLLISAGTGSAQPPTMLGIGLSGDAAVRDTAAVDGDSVYVIVSFDQETGWPVAGVGSDAQALNRITIHGHGGIVPSGQPTQTVIALVDTSSLIVDSLANPRVMSFRFRLPAITNPRVASLQIEIGIFARNSEGALAFSSVRTSYSTVGNAAQLRNPVDALHASYLTFSDVLTYPPVLLEPSANALLPRVFTVRYSQPEQAFRDRLILAFRNEVNDSTTRLFLRDTLAGPNKVVILDALSLYNGLYVDTVQGPSALAHNGMYEVSIAYQDINENPFAGDTVAHVRVDRLTDAPSIDYPSDNTIIARHIVVLFRQPEAADSGSLYLSFTRADSGSGESVRKLYPRDYSIGEKQLIIDALNLFDPLQFDSVANNVPLSNYANYRLTVSYRDTLGNEAAADTVDRLYTVLTTAPPELYEPRMGTARSDSTIPVLYNLPTEADSVWLIFEEDTLGPVHDPISPHILRLGTREGDAGIHSFSMHGRDIGTNNSHVAESNRGANDSLIARVIYSVTLLYGDTLGNDNIAITNYGYVWPEDRTTLPIRILEPVSGQAANHDLRITFDVPENPLTGNIRVNFLAIPDSSDPGSPHNIYMRSIPQGTSSVSLDAAHFNYSPLVDSVRGDGTFEEQNALLDGSRYILSIYYRDYLGNPEARSSFATIRYDNSTRNPSFVSPADGDTIPRVNFPVRIIQPEDALPGTLKLTLTQIGGYAVDPGSPHILFLSDPRDTYDSNKVVVVQPLALYSSTGIDSAQGGPDLLIRSYYQMSVSYQDTLGNPAVSATLGSLVYGSGAVVQASGGPVGSGEVIPGLQRAVVFRVSLRADGNQSVLRSLHFSTFRNGAISDLVAAETAVWQSVDTTFVEGEDPRVGTLSSWTDGVMRFDSMSAIVGNDVLHFLVTMNYSASAAASHSIGLLLPDPESIDCGTDPVVADGWPIGNQDYPLAVALTGFDTEQDTLFGALRVWWTVASEADNAGFILLRRAADEDTFRTIATHATAPELVGRGWDSSAGRYQYIDRGLTPGTLYEYRLRAVSFGFYQIEFEATAQGTPRIPPTDFQLGSAYPNPFNQTVSFSYVVPYSAHVEVSIFDVLGRKVKTVISGTLAPAEYRTFWDGRDERDEIVPSGIYFCRMSAGNRFNQARKMILVR